MWTSKWCHNFQTISSILVRCPGIYLKEKTDFKVSWSVLSRALFIVFMLFDSLEQMISSGGERETDSVLH